MKHNRVLPLLVLVLSFFSTSTYAEVPPDVVKSGKAFSVEATDEQIVIRAKGITEPQLQMLEAPPRAVVDIPKFIIPDEPRLILTHNPLLKSIRLGRHEEFTRVVLDFKGTTTQPIKLIKNPNEVIIILGTAGSPEKAPPIPPTLAAKPVESPVTTSAPTSTPIRIPALSPTKAPTATPIVATPVPANTKVPQSPTVVSAPPSAVEVELPELKLTVNSLYVHFPYNNRPVQDLVVKNKSTTPLFVTSSVDAVIHPGMPDESFVPTTQLLASPHRFQVAPNESHGVRLVIGTGLSRNSESVFRVNLIPDTKPFEVQTLKDPKPNSTGLTVLAVVEPQNAKPDITWEWDNDSITILNRGNANVFLDRGKACSSAQCETLSSRRLYPNSSWTIPVEKATSLEFLQSTGDKFKQLEIKRDKKS